MFGVGSLEIVLILAIALIVLGPDRLPQAMGTVGRWIRELRRLTGEFRKEFDRSKIQVYIKQNDEWIIGGIKKVYDITFNGIAGESFECYNIKEAEEYLEQNWEEITENLRWDIETDIEEGE